MIFVRRVEILLDGDSFVQGTAIKGSLLVRTDTEFRCERVSVALHGETGTSSPRGTVVGRQNVVAQETVLSGPTTISAGESMFYFRFNLPETAPPSYLGWVGYVRYNVSAHIEISRGRDLSASKEVVVVPRVEPLQPQRSEDRIVLGEMSDICVEIPSDILTPGQPFLVRHMVRGDPSVRGIRLEIIKTQRRSIGDFHMEMDVPICKEYVDRDQLAYNSWSETVLTPDANMIVSVETETMHVGYVLKVTADIPWRRDRSVTLPLRVGRSVSEQSQGS